MTIQFSSPSHEQTNKPSANKPMKPNWRRLLGKQWESVLRRMSSSSTRKVVDVFASCRINSGVDQGDNWVCLPRANFAQLLSDKRSKVGLCLSMLCFIPNQDTYLTFERNYYNPHTRLINNITNSSFKPSQSCVKLEKKRENNKCYKESKAFAWLECQMFVMCLFVATLTKSLLEGKKSLKSSWKVRMFACKHT